MKNYFVFANYYLSCSASPIECDSMLMTWYDDCLTAWNFATKYFHSRIEDKGYSKFVISDIKEIK